MIGFLKESVFVLSVLGFFVFVVFWFGRQTITNLIVALYFAFLISLQFPYYELLLSKTESVKTESAVFVALFLIFTTLATLLVNRLIPRFNDETLFEGSGKKLLLALTATTLVTAFSYHAVPVTELIAPGGTPVSFLFGSAESFFWWLIAPLLVLFFVKP